VSRPTCNPEMLTTMRHRHDWHEDYGPVLWWTAPVEEAPYCGTPLDTDWPDYHQWWTPLPNVTCGATGKRISPNEVIRR
jgi:hypothetical protein